MVSRRFGRQQVRRGPLAGAADPLSPERARGEGKGGESAEAGAWWSSSPRTRATCTAARRPTRRRKAQRRAAWRASPYLLFRLRWAPERRRRCDAEVVKITFGLYAALFPTFHLWGGCLKTMWGMLTHHAAAPTHSQAKLASRSLVICRHPPLRPHHHHHHHRSPPRRHRGSCRRSCRSSRSRQRPALPRTSRRRRPTPPPRLQCRHRSRRRRLAPSLGKRGNRSSRAPTPPPRPHRRSSTPTG